MVKKDVKQAKPMLCKYADVSFVKPCTHFPKQTEAYTHPHAAYDIDDAF